MLERGPDRCDGIMPLIAYITGRARPRDAGLLGLGRVLVDDDDAAPRHTFALGTRGSDPKPSSGRLVLLPYVVVERNLRDRIDRLRGGSVGARRSSSGDPSTAGAGVGAGAS